MKPDKSKFSTAPYVKKIEKPWGYELIFAPEDAPYTGKLLHVKSGAKLSLQYHDEKQETLMLISGKAKIVLDDEKGEIREIEMEKNKGYTIVPFQKHRIIGVEDANIIEASMPETGKTYRVEDVYQRSTETEEMRKLPDRGWKKPAHEKKR